MAVTQSKVGIMVKALNVLEEDIDSLDGTVSDMKRQLNLSAQAKYDDLMEKTRQMATAEAESIIEEARVKATAEAEKIGAQAESRLEEISADIDTGFEDAVKDAVSMILKPQL